MVNTFLIELGIKILIALIFILVNTLILRAIAIKIFKIKDKSYNTPLAIVIWLGFAIIIASYIKLTAIAVTVLVLANLFFIYLVKKEYKKTLETSLKIWLLLFIINLVIGAVVVLLLM